MKSLFIREGRLRSGWRLLTYLIAKGIITLLPGFVIAFVLLAQGVPPQALSTRLTGLLNGGFWNGGGLYYLLTLLLALGVVYLWRHWMDKRTVRSLGLQFTPGWWKELILGMGVIGLVWVVILLFGLATSAVVVTGFQPNVPLALSSLLAGLLLNLMVGFNEEIDARGYMLQNLGEGIGLGPAIIVSSAYFGALHLLNPGAGWGSTLGVALAGVFLALGYWVTGHLWFPIGMHAAWNFFEGPVLGFLVSGLQMGGLLQLNITGPEWLTGGSFGPEAGALTIIPELVLIGLLIWWGRRKQQRTVV